MAYDPQRDRPRRRGDANEPAPVDSLLDGVSQPQPDDAAPSPGSPPADVPADTPAADGPVGSWSDRLLYSGGLSTMLKAAVVVAALGWLWRRIRRRRQR